MTNFNKRVLFSATAILAAAVFANRLIHPSAATAHASAKERARIVLTAVLPKLEGDRLKATLVEVNYGPGEFSQPHSHSCPVVVYVVQGTIRSQVKGEPEMTLKAGETFYEPANGTHLVSANASSTAPAKFIAFLLCDHDTPDAQPHSGAKP
jgi:quercetin dioxygenase-like cupin family protein